MRVLVIKTSSLGDVIHTLPALTDATRAITDIRFDWVVEEAFAEIPGWHPAVEHVIPVAIRRWRAHPLRTWRSGEWRACRARLGDTEYDAVIDAQGLLKSAWLTRHVRGPVHGLDRASVRESFAARFYDHHHHVPGGRHAVERVRALFAQALGYALPDTDCDYGLAPTRIAGFAPADSAAPTLLFLHGTTWGTKHWPEAYWRELAERCCVAGWRVHLPWGNEAERARAERIAQGVDGATVLPRLPLAGIAAELASASACVAVDTGLGHLAAAFDVPTVSLFGPTNPGLTGAWGPRQTHLASDLACAPCLARTCRLGPGAPERAGLDPRAEPPCHARLPPERVQAVVDDLVARHARATPVAEVG